MTDPGDHIQFYSMAEVLAWHNEWSKYHRLVSLGGAIAQSAQKPDTPFSEDEIVQEIFRRRELDQID